MTDFEREIRTMKSGLCLSRKKNQPIVEAGESGNLKKFEMPLTTPQKIFNLQPQSGFGTLVCSEKNIFEQAGTGQKD